MLYIRVHDQAGGVTGVEAVESPCFCRWQHSNSMMVCCDRAEAQYLISADGERRYAVGGQMPTGEPEPWAEEITQAEFEAEREPVPEPEEEEPIQEQEEQPMTRAELTERVEQLQAKVQELSEMNELMIGAVMEMSEIAYA